MNLTEIILGVFVLLVTPGPTNTLIALAGGERGLRRALPLIGAEVAGYLTMALPLALLGQGLVGHAPVRVALTVGAAIWVGWLAVGMWRLPPPGTAGRTVDARAVYVTTLLNPKALIFGLVLLPAADPARLALNGAVFAAEIAVVAAGWMALGAILAGGGGTGLPGCLRRAAALWLGALALWLAARGAGMAA